MKVAHLILLEKERRMEEKREEQEKIGNTSLPLGVCRYKEKFLREGYGKEEREEEIAFQQLLYRNNQRAFAEAKKKFKREKRE